MDTKTKGIRMIKKIKGNIWRVEKTINGIKFDRSYSRKCDAEAYLATLEAMIVSRNGSNGYVKKIKFGELHIMYLGFINKYRDEATYKKSLAVSLHLKPLAEMDYMLLTEEEIIGVFKNARNIKNKEPLSQSYLSNILVSVIGIFEIAEENGFSRKGKKKLIEEIVRVVNSGTPPKPKKHYRQAQVAQWFHSEEKKDFWVRTMGLILVTTSLRIGEVIAMTWKNIDLDNKTFYVCQMVSSDRFHPHLKKNAPPYEITLEDTVVERLKLLRQKDEDEGVCSEWVFPSMDRHVDNYPEDNQCPYKRKPISYDKARYYVRCDQANAGLKPINLHGLRITGATLDYIRNKGTPLAWDRVKKKLNHRSLSTSEGYIQIATADIEQMEREQNKDSFLDYCLGSGKAGVQNVQKEVIQSEEELIDRQIMIEEKRTKLLELKKRNDELAK